MRETETETETPQTRKERNHNRTEYVLHAEAIVQKQVVVRTPAVAVEHLTASGVGVGTRGVHAEQTVAVDVVVVLGLHVGVVETVRKWYL
jgi:hypothetical protein